MNKKKNKKSAIGAGYNPPFNEETLTFPVAELPLREDTLQLLTNAGIETVRDVVIRTEQDFYRIPTFNKKNLADVKNAANKKNVFLRPMPEKEEDEKEEQAKKPEEKAKPEQGKPARPPQQGKEKASKGKDRDKQGNATEKRDGLSAKPQRPKVEPIKEEPDIYVKINKGGKWGFKDRSGNVKVAPVYDEVFSYKEDVCCVEKEEHFGYINREGEEIIPPAYDCAISFSEGYACVYKGEKCGYINKSNEVVVPFKFDAATPIINGESRVKKDGKWGEMHIENPDDIRWIN